VLLVHCDALELPRHVAPGSAQLAYLDPPFSVGVAFGARTKKSQRRARNVPDAGPFAYDDRWPSLEAYLAWLEPRIAATRSLLSSTGTLWLHLDQRAVHEAKGVADRVFGRQRFVGEVIWVPGNGTKARKGPGVSHQTLLLYAKGTSFVWNGRDPALRAPFAATSLAMHFTNTDGEGRLFRERTIGNKTYRYYADHGRALGSVWTDCPAMIANTPLHKEGTGYPTQKPLKLLERIVRASTEPGALVIDPFCGSGTTMHAAARLGRDAVGADVGELAIATAARRLREAKIAFNLDGRSQRRGARGRAETGTGARRGRAPDDASTL
jgi:site-specific DNA-methyltransferase (adenine-specific)